MLKQHIPVIGGCGQYIQAKLSWVWSAFHDMGFMSRQVLGSQTGKRRTWTALLNIW